MKGVIFVGVVAVIVGVIAWLQKDQKAKAEAPDLSARYRAAWNITNDEIRHGDEAA